ncbi:MIP/aquaporin family protein [Streptomyces microflavus]|uniref:Aquaporin n=1 Tax=Streptomyces microflavus TaxID=1919 RepID=A0A7H8MJG6_STRMI|nr:aquaporin [Streptomyces microflavus]QKW42426.1 aquaporin [Streptomyces microflavus]
MALTPAHHPACPLCPPAPEAPRSPADLPSPAAPRSPGLLRRAVCEFGLTAVLLLAVVSGVRWLFAPDGYGGGGTAFALLGAGVGALLAALMVSAPGRRSGGHLNPAVTLALWRLGAFPGRDVVPYLVAQLSGSVVGTWLAGLVWGPVVSLPPVSHAVVRTGPGWGDGAVVAAEAGVLAGSALLLAGLLARPVGRRVLPYAVGVVTALVIAVLGPLSGGSANPARQFGPALLTGEPGLLWVYGGGPVLGAVVGAGLVAMVRGRRGAGRAAVAYSRPGGPPVVPGRP